MKAYDFMYDGKSLSEFGFIVCNFDSKGVETVSAGSEISFNTVPVLGGSKFELVSVQYENCLEAPIQICKNICSGGALDIEPHEFRRIVRWLNRKKFLKFKPLSDEYIDVYFEASFNVSKIEANGKIIGLELQATTNSPFAFKEPQTIIIKNEVVDGKHSVKDSSYEEGYIYPYTEITIDESGDLSIHNDLENRNVVVKNCVKGETITMDYPIISTTESSHNIQNDFNWNFFRIANTYENNRNDLTISLPCTIKAKYSPIVKIGL